jgi:hypothetical protein
MNLSGKGAAYGAVGGLLGGAAVGYLAGEGTKAVRKRTGVGAVSGVVLGAVGGALLGPSSTTSSSSSGNGGATVAAGGGGGGGGGGGDQNVTPTNQAIGSSGLPRHLNGVGRGTAGLSQLTPARLRA